MAIDALSAWTDDAPSSIKTAIEEEAMSLSADAFALSFSFLSQFQLIFESFLAISSVLRRCFNCHVPCHFTRTRPH